MRKIAAAVACGLVLAAAPARAQTSPETFLESVDPFMQFVRTGVQKFQKFVADQYSGLADYEGCSASVVRLTPNEDARAVVMTNAHCLDDIRPDFYYDSSDFEHPVSIYARGGAKSEFTTRRLIYAAKTGTDIALLELPMTYRELKSLGIDAYGLSPEPAKTGDPVVLASGSERVIENCKIDGIVFKLKEGEWEFSDSYKYGGCYTAHGYSGSPLISPKTGLIVGIHSTHNYLGKECLPDNPCEIDKKGRVTVEKGERYGQRVDRILTCLDSSGAFDAAAPSCGLFHKKHLVFREPEPPKRETQKP